MAEVAQQPAGGGHWLAAAPPNLRANVTRKMMKNMAQFHGYQLAQLQRYQLDQLRDVTSRYEATVFRESGNMQDYLRIIGKKMMSLQQKYQPAVQAASDHQQQQAHQMRPPLNAVLANSSAAVMPQTASTIPLSPRPPQLQNLHIDAGQASNAAAMQIVHPEGQNSQRSAAGEVDWREDMFRNITSLKDAHLSEIVEFERALRAGVPLIKTSEQLKPLPANEQSDDHRNVVNVMAKIRSVMGFLQLQKSNIPEVAKNQLDKCLDKWQTTIYSLLLCYREIKASDARKNVRQSHNCHELPRVVNIAGATDDS